VSVALWRGIIIALVLSAPFWYAAKIVAGRFFTEVKW
jgi:hypothetical protein